MPTQISQEWPDEISVDVVTPLTVLRTLASSLEQKTKGILRAEIVHSHLREDLVQLSFDIVAPAVGHYRHQLLIAQHHPELVYPVDLTGDFLDDSINGQGYYRYTQTLSTQQQLEKALMESIRSPNTLAVINSLIARSSEVGEAQVGSITQSN